MKKLLIIAFTLLLIIACKEANELEITPEAPDGVGSSDLPVVSAISPSVYGQLTDQNSVKTGIQAKIEVTFSDFMDVATITESNVILRNTATGSDVTTFTTEYFPESKKLFIYVDTAASASLFLLRLVTGGMTNTYGSSLDFDGDNFADGTPYDDYHASFWTAGATDTIVTRTQPKITSVSPESLAINVQQPLITINFNSNMDTTTLNTSTITLEDENGNTQTLTVTNKTLTSIELQPASNLALATNYLVTVNCASIERLGDSETPSYLLALDGDDDGPEETEPDIQWSFRVDDPTLPPTASLSTGGITNGVRYIFSDLIDETTITTTTLRVYDGIGHVPGHFRIYDDGVQTFVEYYYKRSLSGSRRAFVSKSIQATNGYFYDGNGNGIGGEPWDDKYIPY